MRAHTVPFELQTDAHKEQSGAKKDKKGGGKSSCVMLAEGFLRVLRYREERKFASASKLKRSQAHTHCADPFSCIVSDSNSTDLQTDSAEAGKQPYKVC